MNLIFNLAFFNHTDELTTAVETQNISVIVFHHRVAPMSCFEPIVCL